MKWRGMWSIWRMRWTGDAKCVEDMRNSYRTSILIPAVTFIGKAHEAM
jgi:hypothetical protein